jgi:penicillin-binding protein 1C
MSFLGHHRFRAIRQRRRIRLALLLATIGCAGWFLATLHRGLFTPTPSKLIVDRRGLYLGEVPSADDAFGYWPVPYELPERIVRATIETEDRHFYDHAGVHVPSILRAIGQNLRHRSVLSGASTLAMQVARMQSPESRSIWHKLHEGAEAWLLVHDFGHERILRQYLTIAPYGNRVHGVVRAARMYFDKPVEDLSWSQAAFLAGLPQAPGRMNPYEPSGLKRALRRSHRTLRMLHERGYLSADELKQSLAADLGLVPRQKRQDDALHAVLAWSEEAKHRQEPVLQATIDLDIQATTARILREDLARLEDAGAGNAAALVVDTATGDVLAHVGSADYFDEKDHGALDYVRVKRSPGSALKPFIYALALESGRWTAASEVPDTPAEYLADQEGAAYLPENINHAYLGPMLLREALGNSRNIPALRVLADVGVEKMLRFFEKGGVTQLSWTPGAYGLGLAIGNMDVTLEELTGLYLALAHDGVTLPLRRFTSDPPVAGKRMLGAETAQMLTHILSDPLARRPSFTAGGTLDYDFAVAVKTGTSQGHRDAWTVAYSDRLLVAVWVGNHDRRRMKKLTGAGAAGQAVHEIMEAVMPLREPQRAVLDEFPTPRGYTTASVCPLSGKKAGPDCPDAKVEVFAPGTEPVEKCPYHVRLRIDRRNGLRAGLSCPAKFVAERPMLALPGLYEGWARTQHLELAPTETSPFCPDPGVIPTPKVTIREPHDRARFLWDPDSTPEASGVLLSAHVAPSTEDVVWIVDGRPVAQVGFPHEYRLTLTPGLHTIVAALAHSDVASRPITIAVEN